MHFCKELDDLPSRSCNQYKRSYQTTRSLFRLTYIEEDFDIMLLNSLERYLLFKQFLVLSFYDSCFSGKVFVYKLFHVLYIQRNFRPSDCERIVGNVIITFCYDGWEQCPFIVTRLCLNGRILLSRHRSNIYYASYMWMSLSSLQFLNFKEVVSSRSSILSRVISPFNIFTFRYGVQSTSLLHLSSFHPVR